MITEYGNVKLVGVDFNNPSFKMVGGMSIDDLKIKYNWFFNAEVIDAVIGEDENGLVWYSGEWVCGTWEKGTWYSGTFHSGRWKDGQWFSYDINKEEALKGNLVINRTDINKSQFIDGTWEGGVFNYGIFGSIRTDEEIPVKPNLNFVIDHSIDYLLSGETYYYITVVEVEIKTGSGFTYDLVETTIYVPSPIFQSGEIMDGWVSVAKINGGNFQYGFINNSLWYDGNFYNGYFLGDIWYDGEFFGGDFSNGIWKNGKLTSFNEIIKTRFGVDYKGIGATWENGTFMNAEFHSKLNEDEKLEPLPSIDNSKVIWYNGEFVNGEWFGGTFMDGKWDTGTFYSGIIHNIDWYRGHFNNGIWLNGTWRDGTISSGLFKNIESYNIKLGHEI